MNINEINSIVQDVVFLDIETSGLNPYTSEILEIGAIKIENNKLTSFHTFVRNKKEVPLEVFSLCTNLNQNDLDKAPNLYEIKNDLLRFLVQAGYMHTTRVDQPFYFSKRGGVVDIFSMQYDHPIRIDFFVDDIDFIYFFDE